jgi:uncharacterized protein (TIGR03083 family)
MASESEPRPEPAQLPIAPQETRTAALAELQRLADFVAGLSIEDWARPSAAQGWSVGDVVTHLNLALGLYGRLLGSAIGHGGGGAVWQAFGKLSQAVGPAASPAFNAVNNALPRVLDRALAPEVLKGQLAASARTMRERLMQISPGDYTVPVYYMGGPWPLSFFLAATVNEMAIHRWDMESRLREDAHLDTEARALLPWFYWSATPFMFRPPKAYAGAVAATLRDPDLQLWWSTEAGATTQHTGSAPSADVTISGESGTFVLALSGRIPADDALRSTSLTAAGDEAKANTFLSAWKIV